MAKAQGSLITELERAIHSGSHERSEETLRRVTDLFLAGADRFSEDQVLLFEDVLGFLIQRIETRARAELQYARPGSSSAIRRSGSTAPLPAAPIDHRHQERSRPPSVGTGL